MCHPPEAYTLGQSGACPAAVGRCSNVFNSPKLPVNTINRSVPSPHPLPSLLSTLPYPNMSIVASTSLCHTTQHLFWAHHTGFSSPTRDGPHNLSIHTMPHGISPYHPILLGYATPPHDIFPHHTAHYTSTTLYYFCSALRHPMLNRIYPRRPSHAVPAHNRRSVGNIPKQCWGSFVPLVPLPLCTIHRGGCHVPRIRPGAPLTAEGKINRIVESTLRNKIRSEGLTFYYYIIGIRRGLPGYVIYTYINR